MNDFVHLHLHTEYSLLDGACHVPELVAQAKKLGMGAIALTDHGNMFGAVAFHDECREAGIKPILGCEIYVAPGSRYEKKGSGIQDVYHHMTLLATDDVGYHNLVELVSLGYTEGFYHRPRIDKESLQKHSQGLVGLSGCLKGDVATRLLRRGDDAALEAVGQYAELFGPDRFYLEMMDHGIPEQRRVNEGLLRLHEKTGLPLVATNDTHYLHKDDHQAHDVLLAIGSGKKVQDENRLRYSTDEFYLKSAAEMAQVFPDHPGALANTVKIAEMTDFELGTAGSLPAFDVPEGYTVDSYFEEVSRRGFADRREDLERLPDAGARRRPTSVYEERLNKEIAVIQRVGFAGYFLIVWDFIRYAREQEIPVGPGRGSAAGSLVAYSMRITDIDPIEQGLIFERFLNEERVSPPDVDIDFCENRRGEVIDYVTQKYGRANVAQIITFGTMKAKAVIRDVGRVLDMSYADVDRIAKMIPFDLQMTLEKALAESPPLKEAYEKDPSVKELIDISRRLEGTQRHASTHAAGVVIAPEPLTHFVPLFKGSNGDITTQFDMKGIERIGLLKMDFLGLRTLTMIDNCVRMIGASGGDQFRIDSIPTDDAKAYQLFAAGKTSGLFQFESEGMRDILRRFEPDRLEHLTALNALYRPGPMQMIEDFIRRRHATTALTYELPALEPILSETYGVMVYQEQVMQIASTLAGFTLGEADILRKAMGKKKADVMGTQKEKFLDGCKQRDVPAKKARRIWDQMEQFAGYGFNKSHSAAYALLAYQTGYLKANYPLFFMAALLTSERHNTDRMVGYIGECRELGIEVKPPDVNQSDSYFTVVDGQIRFGMAAIKNVGEGAVEVIVAARADGPFTSLYDFCERVNLHSVNKRVVESLIKSGSFDSLDARRAALTAVLDRAMESGQSRQRDREQGQASLFGGQEDSDVPAHQAIRDVPEWSESERLGFEKESLGFFITGHPLDRYAEELRQWATHTTASLADLAEGGDVSIGGIIGGMRLIKTRKGDRMASFVLEDTEGSVEALVFPKTYRELAGRLVEDQVVLVKGRAERLDDGRSRLLIAEVLPLDEAKRAEARHVTIRVPIPKWSTGKGSRLAEICQGHSGNCSLTVELVQPGTYRARIASRYRVQPEEGFAAEIEALLGPDALVLSRRAAAASSGRADG